jgi:hypothetical protein
LTPTKQEFGTFMWFLATISAGNLGFSLTRILMRYRVDVASGVCLGVGIIFLVLSILSLGMEEN